MITRNSKSYDLNDIGSPSGFFKVKFSDDDLEEVYNVYFARQKKASLQVFLVFALLFDITVFAFYVTDYSERSLATICVLAVFCIINLCLLGLSLRDSAQAKFFKLFPYIVWFILAAQLHTDLAGWRNPVAPGDASIWQVLLVVITSGLLPVRLRWCLFLALLSCALHTIMICVLGAKTTFYFGNGVAANMLIYLSAAVLGTVLYFYLDRKQRRDFVETKSSMEVKSVIQQESREQERLLLSVLPKYVAEEMINDLGEMVAYQFRKIYMNRYENASILFADMVGFTAISSKCTAAELVRILNELFANFDKLANKYCQLRIKILGDCYYCICGAPDARPDHAVLCIHMGLAVIEAIKDIQEKIKANVNMRVGIHTGAVLAGVLGQRQWQFDVLGKEVTLANQMESGGVPGRVHISEVTKNCLKDEFELEPGHGDRREDAIRLANITTYLIKSVLRPFPQGTLLANETGGKQVAEKLETNEDKENPKELMANFQRQLHKALIDREKTISVSGAMNWATLFFKDQEMEKKFNQKKEEFSGICMMSLCAVLLLCFTAELCVLPCAVGRVMAFVIGELALITLTVFTLPVSFPKKFPVQLVHVSDALDNITVVRTLMSLTAVVILVTVPIVPLFECSHPSILNETLTQLHPYDQRCLYSSYTTYLVMTSLVSLALLFQIPYLVKLLLMLCVTALLNVFNIVLVPRLFDLYDSVVHSKSTGSFIPTKFVLCGNSVTFTLVLFYLNRHMEKSARKLFLWKEEAEKQKKQVAELRQKNEALVYNILPHHVAKDFLGSNRNHEELYSNAYEEVGVIFAACPNFNSFYNESSVNNNGLECLRFLNEIISDYDELLSQPQFASITKIKTVGSTYMAASGMTENQNTLKSVNMKKRWKHLDSIVQFAFCLRDTLEKINTQSFNNFVLRVGLNHGPIIAGVIGAQKPHYDIWGNTVNVSSRMESTGQAGKIQVVEETMLILKEFGYRFEKRGRIKVKGKGELLTFFVENRDTSDSSFAMPNQMPES